MFFYYFFLSIINIEITSQVFFLHRLFPLLQHLYSYFLFIRFQYYLQLSQVQYLVIFVLAISYVVLWVHHFRVGINFQWWIGWDENQLYWNRLQQRWFWMSEKIWLVQYLCIGWIDLFMYRSIEWTLSSVPCSPMISLLLFTDLWLFNRPTCCVVFIIAISHSVISWVHRQLVKICKQKKLAKPFQVLKKIDVPTGIPKEIEDLLEKLLNIGNLAILSVEMGTLC